MQNKTSQKKKNVKEEINIHPLLTVKGVVYDKQNDKVLLLKRAKSNGIFSGLYDLPGGGWDKGETIEECLQREVKEETGLEIELSNILAVREYPKEHKMFDKVKALRFLAYYQGGEVKLSREHDFFEWLTFEEVKNKLANKKLSKDDWGYEKEKQDTILLAREYLKKERAVENWQRAIADFENYKKQIAKQNEEFKKYAGESVIMDILPVLDNFQSALEHIPKEEQSSGWVTGVMYIQKQLLDILAGHGVQKLEVKIGDNFDANLHEAIKSGKINEGIKKKKTAKQKDVISKVIKNGYKIGDKIIRPAMVEVE